MPAAHPVNEVLARIRAAELRHGRPAHAVQLLAVSKMQPAEAVRAAAAAGQRAFGENYVQEALPKLAALDGLDLSWHFIGRLQANKTREIATRFSFVHALDRLRIAERLSAQRPAALGPLDCCIEVNVSGEATKGGVTPAGLPALAAAVSRLPGLRLRGLMCLPAPSPSFEAQRAGFRRLRELLDSLGEPGLDTLSMGTSADFEAAIAEGATMVRIGVAVFGPRPARRRVEAGPEC